MSRETDDTHSVKGERKEGKEGGKQAGRKEGRKEGWKGGTEGGRKGRSYFFYSLSFKELSR